MTLLEVKTMLEGVGLPVAYDHFESEVAMPYITYKETSTRTVSMDDSVGAKISTIQVELYTASRELETEALLEDVLSTQIWSRTLNFEDDDYYYATFYQFEIIR